MARRRLPEIRNFPLDLDGDFGYAPDWLVVI